MHTLNNGYRGLSLLLLLNWDRILVLLAIGGVVFVAVWFIGQSSRRSQAVGRQPHQEDEALKILRRRYAAGEIDREEFERMREELGS